MCADCKNKVCDCFDSGLPKEKRDLTWYDKFADTLDHPRATEVIHDLVCASKRREVFIKEICQKVVMLKKVDALIKGEVEVDVSEPEKGDDWNNEFT